MLTKYVRNFNWPSSWWVVYSEGLEKCLLFCLLYIKKSLTYTVTYDRSISFLIFPSPLNLSLPPTLEVQKNHGNLFRCLSNCFFLLWNHRCLWTSFLIPSPNSPNQFFIFTRTRYAFSSTISDFKF